MNTIFLLMAEFESAAVKLSDCYHYLGYTTNKHAQEAARTFDTPIPVFRGSDSQKAPRMVRLVDLANYLDQRADDAKDRFEKVHS